LVHCNSTRFGNSKVFWTFRRSFWAFSLTKSGVSI